MIRVYPPKGDWKRHHPTAKRIAAVLRLYPELSALRYRCRVSDVCERFGVSKTTAKVALRFAAAG